MSQNADQTYAWKLLASTLRAEVRQLDDADREISRLQAKKGEAASRIALLEAAITNLGGDLVEARKP